MYKRQVQYYCDAKLDMIVQPACFMPRPKVASAVITLKVLPERKVETADEKLFFHLVKCAFVQRRKTLMNCLFHLGNLGFSKEELAELLEELGWDTRVRGEALGLEEFAADVYKRQLQILSQQQARTGSSDCR